MKKIFYVITITICVFMLSSEYINAWSEYTVGKEVEYNGIKFYVIEDSDKDNDTVKLLKDIPLKSSEMLGYLSSTEIYGKTVSTGISTYRVLDLDGEFLKVAYYASDMCATSYYSIVCNVDYMVSDVKQIVDVWASNFLNKEDLKQDSTGYSVRLLTYEELTNDLGIQIDIVNPTEIRTIKPEKNSDWIFRDYYQYWTMAPKEDQDSTIWTVQKQVLYPSMTSGVHQVRPVIILKKSALGDTNEQEEINKDDTSIVTDNNSAKESKVAVNVPNTLEKISIIFIMIGIVLVSVSVVIVVRNRNIFNKKNGEK